MLQPENQTKKYDFLFADIDTGRIKIPRFQRDFVWTKEQTARLIDSIIKGFPIGTFILWRTRQTLRDMKEIGNERLPDPPRGEPVTYVLDGQQRITSLYAVRKGVVFTKEGQTIDYKEISINLDLDPDSDERVVTVDPPLDATWISVHQLLTCEITDLLDTYSKEILIKINTYKKRLTGYDFSTILMADYPLDLACEVFTRINTGGTELTLFEIMVAKTYDAERNFDLAERYDILINNNNHGKDLEDADYDTIPASTVLQCVAACLLKQIRRRDILAISRDDIIDAWPMVVDALFTAVDFLHTSLRIPVSQMLPYNSLLVPLTYFFYQNKGAPPSERQTKLLTQFFFWASLTNRYSSGTETKMGKDIERMDCVLMDEAPSYRGEELQLRFEDLHYYWFSTGDAFCKAILCLYAYYIPRSFNNDALVVINNSWLKTTISKNYHHFFPRSYLTKSGVPDWKANSILNITIVDDHLNKSTIKAKAPSQYMATFKKGNKKLQETMRSHLIDDLDAYGIWNNDYEAFLEARGKRVLEEINLRLNPEL